MKKKKKWKKVAGIIISSNIAIAVLTYLVIGNGACFEVEKPVSDGGVMNYFIAGNLAQPRQAFSLFTDGYASYQVDGGITYATFSTIGYRPSTVAKQIEEDALAHNFQAHIWTISLGDEVARELESRGNLKNMEICSINPCVDISTVSEKMRTLVKVFVIPAGAIKVALGMISYIPFIQVDGGNYSVSTLIDQYLAIYSYRASKDAADYKNTKLVVYSQDDWFLDNNTVSQYFQGVKNVIAETEHGNTVLGKDAYLDVMIPELINMGWMVIDE